MSFGWSIGDVVAGLNVVWNVWQAVSDGPLNAKFEASQFFDEFIHIVSRLEEWERKKPIFAQDERLQRSHEQMRDQCTEFIKRHMVLIQNVNPQTKAIRPKRSNWLKNAPFTRSQVVELYQQVTWPAERKTVARLREKLEFFLNLAAWDIGLDTNNMVRDIRASNADLLSSNLKLVSSHLDLVSLVALNLKRVTYPLEPGQQAQEIDYPMLRQFEQALSPPRPLQRLAAPRQDRLPWQTSDEPEDEQYALATQTTPSIQLPRPVDQSQVRGIISQRLDNLSMRVKRVETLESISETGSNDGARPPIQPLLHRLRDMRDQIGNAVGVLNSQVPYNQVALVASEPENALRQELEAWNQLEERIEREILHPRRIGQSAPSPSYMPTSSTKPINIPQTRSPPSLSPNSSPSGRYGFPSGSISPNSQRSSFFSPSQSMSFSHMTADSTHSSPPYALQLSHSRSNSTSSASQPNMTSPLDREIPVHLYYADHAVNAVIESVSRSEEGDVQKISAISRSGHVMIRHYMDPNAISKIDTSMIPFLDNGHADKTHKLRMQFLGAHHLKITTRAEGHGDKTVTLQCAPIYKFHNEHDFRQFQSILLNKEVKFCADFQFIKSTDKDIQCRLGAIRILFDPIDRTRHILYFRHTPDQRHGFVEWPVHLFKDPKEPNKKSKTLTLESSDGRSLSFARSLSRRSTSGSVATINSFESSPAPAFARMQERSASHAGKGIKGLVIEFHEPHDCHEFWMEFKKKEAIFQNSPVQGLGIDLNVTPSH